MRWVTALVLLTATTAVGQAGPALYDEDFAGVGAVLIEIHATNASIVVQGLNYGGASHVAINIFSLGWTGGGGMSTTTLNGGWNVDVEHGAIARRIGITQGSESMPQASGSTVPGLCTSGCYFVLWSAGSLTSTHFKITSSDPAASFVVRNASLETRFLEGRDLDSEEYLRLTAIRSVNIQRAGVAEIEFEGRGVGFIGPISSIGDDQTTFEGPAGSEDCPCRSAPFWEPGSYLLRRDATSVEPLHWFAAFVDVVGS